MFNAVKLYVSVEVGLKNLINLYQKQFLFNTMFLTKYYYLNDLLWQEGFLIDFVQKKTADKFIRKFLILSAYLFSERVIFDKLIRIYSDLIVLFANSKSIYDFNSVANMLTMLTVFIALLLLTIVMIFVLQIHIF